MTRVWQWNRPVTVREVLEDLRGERAIAYTTVMTVMDNLHQKGWLRREQQGRAYLYEAVSTRAAYSAALMNEAWSSSDNPAAALVEFFGRMTPEQRAALRDALRVVQLSGVQIGTSESAAEEIAVLDGPDVLEEGRGLEEGREEGTRPEDSTAGEESAAPGADAAGADDSVRSWRQHPHPHQK